jgi:hypothetical protein
VGQVFETHRANRGSRRLDPPYTARASRKAAILSLFALLIISAGCETTHDLLPGAGDVPPTGKVAQINVAWHNQVVFAPDPMHDGQMTAGLAGRLYLFGPNMGYPLAGDGQVVVDVFDPARKGPDGKPLQLERWNLDQATLKNCLRKDQIGWGYTLLLPWGTYRPDLTQVMLKVHYDMPHSLPIYTEPSTITFNPVLDLQTARSSRPITGSPSGGVAQAAHQTPVNGR